MEHCSEEVLTDFVRGVSSSDQSKAIVSHLTAGCSRCQTAHDHWSKVRRLANAEDAYAPPENLVRLAKLSFVAHQTSQQPRTFMKSVLANLVFDSLAQPLPAGVRSNAICAWQLLYEAEGLSVDLRFGQRIHSKVVHMVGQVFDKTAVGTWLDNAVVELFTEQNQLIVATTVSAMGEFDLEFEQSEHLWLSVKVEGRNAVRIPIAILK